MREWTTLPELDEDERTIIVTSTYEHDVNDRALQALTESLSLYVRGNRLVQIARNEEGIYTIRELPAATLRELLTRRVHFVREVERHGEVVRIDVHPPEWCVNAILSRHELPGFRQLAGVVTIPTLRVDGTLIETPGYDAQSRLFYAPTGAVPSVPSNPTRADAIDALKELLEVVRDFPFAHGAHKSAWLTGLLTLFARHNVGNVPSIVVEANTRGTGKGLLVDTIATIATGKPMPRKPPVGTDEEMRKYITSVARDGLASVLLDNWTGKFNFRSFDAAVTCERLWEDRILGRTERRTLPLDVVWFITANNAALSSDTARRVLSILLRADQEHPEDRQDFSHADLLGWISDERPRLIRAALMCLRAYYVAGRPEQANLVPWGSFQRWCRLFRHCVVWLGQTDPLEAREALRERADVDRNALMAVFQAIGRLGSVTAARLLQEAEKDPDFAEVLVQLVKPEGKDALPTASRLGIMLRDHRDRVVGDWRLVKAQGGHGGAARWTVEVASTRQEASSPYSPKAARGEDGDDGGDGNAGEKCAPPSTGREPGEDDGDEDAA